MVPFEEHLYEATLFAFGRILSRYNAFAQGLILKEAGREILEYLKRQGYEFPKTDSIDGILKVIDAFANNGFVENLEVEEAGEATKFTWHDLYGFEAYRELQEITENPFLSCPLNAVLWYLADGLGKTLKLRDKRFIEEGRTAVSIEQFVDKDAEIHVNQPPFTKEEIHHAEVIGQPFIIFLDFGLIRFLPVLLHQFDDVFFSPVHDLLAEEQGVRMFCFNTGQQLVFQSDKED